MHTLTMSSKGQLTVPKDLRERMGLRPGTKIQASIDAQGRLILIPSLHEPEDLFVDRPPVNRILTVEEMDAAIASALRDHA